ncbi:MAG TPA: GDSL-type esterase/lipase family protein, partial [Prevotella sp.]
DIMENIRRIGSYISTLRSKTELYVLSVYPANRPYRHEIATLNGAIKAYSQLAHCQYIDVYSKLKAPDGGIKSEFSNDGLHLTGKGYQVVAKALKPYLGRCAAKMLSDKMISDVPHAYINQRATLFANLPLKKHDILMFGGMDYNTAEWCELTGNVHVKNRGVGVGTSSNLRLKEATLMVPHLLNGKKKPAKIYLSLGREDLLTHHQDADSVLVQYRQLVQILQQKSKRTTICIQSLLPGEDATANLGTVVGFNKKLKELAQELHTEFVDVYPYFTNSDGTQRESYFREGWLKPDGFRLLAKVLFPQGR